MANLILRFLFLSKGGGHDPCPLRCNRVLHGHRLRSVLTLVRISALVATPLQLKKPVSGATCLKNSLCVFVFKGTLGARDVSCTIYSFGQVTSAALDHRTREKPLVPSVVYGLKTLQSGIGWLCLRRIVLLKPEEMIKQTNEKIIFHCKALLNETRASAIITLLVANRFPWMQDLPHLQAGTRNLKPDEGWIWD